MAQAANRRLDRILAGAAGGGIGGSMGFLVANRALIAWIVVHYVSRDLSWRSLPLLGLDASVSLAIGAGAVLGAVVGAMSTRSLRLAFWAGLAVGFFVAIAITPQVQLVRE